MSNDIVNLDEVACAPSPSGAVSSPEGAAQLMLRYPVTLRLRRGNAEREETVRTLTIRRCNGGDLRALSSAKTDIERAAILFTRMADIPMAVYDRLDAADIEAGMEAIAGFLPGGPKTGTTSLE